MMQSNAKYEFMAIHGYIFNLKCTMELDRV